MEADGAKQLWERSLSENGVRYTTMVGDGDSATYQTIKDTYDVITVVKGECVGHVQKRVGKNLRDLTKKHTKNCSPLADGKGLGGKGRLTQEVIDSMQTYYGRVIRKIVKTDIPSKNHTYVVGYQSYFVSPCIVIFKTTTPVLPDWRTVLVWISKRFSQTNSRI